MLNIPGHREAEEGLQEKNGEGLNGHFPLSGSGSKRGKQKSKSFLFNFSAVLDTERTELHEILCTLIKNIDLGGRKGSSKLGFECRFREFIFLWRTCCTRAFWQKCCA